MSKTKFVAAFLAASCLAAPLAGAATSRSPDQRFTYASPARHAASAGTNVPLAGTVLAGNLAIAYPDGLYFSGEGNTVTGPRDILSPGITSAVQFTPSKSGMAGAAYAAIAIIDGSPYVDLAIYTDDGGIPGTMLWSSPVSVTPVFGTCCQMVGAKIAGGLALTAGTAYWLVAAGSVPLYSSFSGAWALSTTNQVVNGLAATNFDGAGWKSYPTNTPPAYAIMGQ